jgi:hypothetical protein
MNHRDHLLIIIFVATLVLIVTHMHQPEYEIFEYKCHNESSQSQFYSAVAISAKAHIAAPSDRIVINISNITEVPALYDLSCTFHPIDVKFAIKAAKNFTDLQSIMAKGNTNTWNASLVYIKNDTIYNDNDCNVLVDINDISRNANVESCTAQITASIKYEVNPIIIENCTETENTICQTNDFVEINSADTKAINRILKDAECLTHKTCSGYDLICEYSNQCIAWKWRNYNIYLQ